jgi:hypothetical protein
MILSPTYLNVLHSQKIHSWAYIREKVVLLQKTLLQLKYINRTNEGPIKNLTRRFVIHCHRGEQNNC